jgi:hypothetical protein
MEYIIVYLEISKSIFHHQINIIIEYIKMAFPKYSFIEILLFIIFVTYLIFPIKTPFFLASMVDSTVGVISILVVTIYLFFYANPILAILYIFVAYELIRRSSEVTGRVSIIQYTPSQANTNVQIAKMNPSPTRTTLEEEVISTMAPRPHSGEIVQTTFKPVAEYIHGGSSVNF